MGGLRKKMPVTHAMFLLACLAIAGIPPFAGFFSKEEILLAAWENNPVIFWIALITSGLTAFYMFRLYFSIFWNKEQEGHHHGKEGDVFLLIPLVILGIGTVLAGFVPFSHFISSDLKPFETELHLQFSIAPVAVGVIGILLASWMYRKQTGIPENLARNMGGVYKAAKNKFYIDEAWLGFTKGVLFNLIAKPAAWVDRNVVDGLVKGTGSGMEWISYRIKGLQSGKVQQYGLFFLFGVIIIVSVYLFKNVPWR
jgi:NADH-quinone oxidoreductase subunit L